MDVCVLIVLRIMVIFYFHFIQSRTLVVAPKEKRNLLSMNCQPVKLEGRLEVHVLQYFNKLMKNA